jgi:hypothetical protein
MTVVVMMVVIGDGIVDGSSLGCSVGGAKI